MTHVVELVGTWSKSDIAYASGKHGISNDVADKACGFALSNLPLSNVQLRAKQSIDTGISAPFHAPANEAPEVTVTRAKGSKAWTKSRKSMKPTAAFARLVAAKVGQVELIDHEVKSSVLLQTELRAIDSVKHVAKVEAKLFREANPASFRATKAMVDSRLTKVASPSKILSDRAKEKKEKAHSIPEQVQAMLRKFHDLGISIAKKEALGKDASGLVSCREALQSRIAVLIDHCNDKGFTLA